ncbi:MAG: DUF202 domain-containing protein [Armatimonadota bacterium]|nr:DUF202 domain-containing protein [Armatimonadota bacterium]
MTETDNTRDHLANERTFLAWVRTSIALMGFGVVIAKLRFLALDGMAAQALSPHNGERSTWLGVAFAFVGLLTLLFAAVHYQQTRRQIDSGGYQSAHRSIIAFAALLFLLGLASLAYLLSLAPR